MRAVGSVSVLASVLAMGCAIDLSHSGGGDPPVEPNMPFDPPFTVGPTPADQRPVLVAPSTPPPISGGTLLVTRDGKLAVAADPDRDRVSVVSLADRTVLRTIALERGDEPGRVVEDGANRVHVALRKAGKVVAIDLKTGEIVSRRAVCAVPRGLAYEASTDRIHVACAGGQLVTLDANGGDALRTVTLDVDLRDVVSTPSGLFVSRFKSAQLLRVDADGALVGRIDTHGISRMTDKMPTASDMEAGTFEMKQEAQPMDAAIAWRTLASPDGSLTMLHQYALAAPIVLEGPDATPTPTAVPVQQPYGAPPMGGCGGLVQPAISYVDADGTVSMGQPIPAPLLGVDAAVSPDGLWIAIAHAGVRDPEAPMPGGLAFGPALPSLGGHVSIVEATHFSATKDMPVSCAPLGGGMDVEGQTTAVAFNPGMDEAAKATGVWIVAQTREPASLVFLGDPGGSQRTTVDLGGVSMRDTGHDIFHRDAGGGIACASCHAEGGEDGRVWKFEPLGDRRTQAIDVGLEGTAPFHWDGDMPSFDFLVEEVFVHRMGGPEESTPRTAALSKWVFGLRPRTPIVDAASAEAARGRALFESTAVGCAACHAGAQLTSNVNAEVGTTEHGHSLQVPSLLGVGYRAPYLHDGRAATLRDRFDPAIGGGDAHGRTSALSEAQLGDLISYLGSL